MLSFRFAFFARPESFAIVGDSGLVKKKRCQTGMTYYFQLITVGLIRGKLFIKCIINWITNTKTNVVWGL